MNLLPSLLEPRQPTLPGEAWNRAILGLLLLQEATLRQLLQATLLLFKLQAPTLIQGLQEATQELQPLCQLTLHLGLFQEDILELLQLATPLHALDIRQLLPTLEQVTLEHLLEVIQELQEPATHPLQEHQQGATLASPTYTLPCLPLLLLPCPTQLSQILPPRFMEHLVQATQELHHLVQATQELLHHLQSVTLGNLPNA